MTLCGHDAPQGTCLLARRGSIAHGMADAHAAGDIDLIGVVIAPAEHYLGLTEWGSRGTFERRDGAVDSVFYEIRKLVNLLLAGNPNVMSLLWLRDEDYLYRSAAGAAIVAHRRLFASKHVYDAFAAHAAAQLRKMEARDAAGLRRPGEKRKSLILEHGWDTKNAAHCIRLLRMCIEFLETGQMIVRRPDAAELLAIKRGEWPLERVKRHAEGLFAEAAAARDRSRLPDSPDRAGAERLLVVLLRDALGVNNRERPPS